MTPDAPRPDLDEAERPDMLLIDVLSRYRRRVDVHEDDDLVIRRATRLPAFFREELARRRLAVVPIAEYDRRGAAERNALAELAQVRAELAEERSYRTLGGTPPKPDRTWANLALPPPETSAADNAPPLHRPTIGEAP